MTVFSSAIRALFNDRNLTVDAMYIPLVGVPRTLRVITRAPDVYQSTYQSVACTPTLTLEVQVEILQEVSQGDRFIIDDTVYIVQGEPRRDSQRLIWQIDTALDL